MSETTQTTIEEYETVNDPLADVEEGDELRVEYESVYGDVSTAEGEVVDVEDVYPLANSGERVVITIADSSADCMFEEGGTRRVEYIIGDAYAVEGRNGGRWNRISEIGSDTTVEVATPSTDGGRTEAVAPLEDPSAKVCAGEGCTRVIPVGMFDKCSECGGLSAEEEREAEELLEEIEDDSEEADDVELATDGGRDVEEDSSSGHASRIAAQLAMYEDEVEEIRESREDEEESEDEVDRGDGPITDGSGFLEDADDASFCSECQRYRIECRHTRSTASDGGGRTTNMSGGRSWDMVEYEERAAELEEETALTGGEARVAALKELGLSHSEIAEELELAKSTVDENSRRITRRIEESRRTLEEIDFTEGDRVVVDQHGTGDVSGEVLEVVDREGLDKREYVVDLDQSGHAHVTRDALRTETDEGDDVDRGDGVETDGGRPTPSTRSELAARISETVDDAIRAGIDEDVAVETVREVADVLDELAVARDDEEERSRPFPDLGPVYEDEAGLFEDDASDD